MQIESVTNMSESSIERIRSVRHIAMIEIGKQIRHVPDETAVRPPETLMSITPVLFCNIKKPLIISETAFF